MGCPSATSCPSVDSAGWHSALLCSRLGRARTRKFRPAGELRLELRAWRDDPPEASGLPHSCCCRVRGFAVRDRGYVCNCYSSAQARVARCRHGLANSIGGVAARLSMQSNSDVEQQLMSSTERAELVATARSVESEPWSPETANPDDLLGAYVMDRLYGRVEGPHPAQKPGDKFVAPVGPWSELPEWCHIGAWSPAATVFFTATFALLCVTSPTSLGETQREMMAATVAELAAASDFSWTSVVLRAVAGGYGLLLLGGMLKKIGWWPIITYTMISWTLLSLRLLFAAAAPFSTAAAWGAELIRYIALLQTTVVVIVWWLLIVPAILLLEKNHAKRNEFWKWNWSFALINVHCLNLPVAAVDFLNAPRAFMLIDLWIVGAVTLAYVLFYTAVLDRKGIFLYFMFTPRTHWCCVVYAAALVLMGAILWAWVAIGGCGFAW